MRRRGQQAPERDAGIGQAHKEEGKGQEGTSRVINRIQKIGKSAEQSEGSRKAGTNRHQQPTYTSDSAASSAVPIRSSRPLTQEGKGHGRGRAAEKTKGQKRQEEAKRSKNGVQEPKGKIWTGQQLNADRTPRSDTGRKNTDPYRQEGQHSHKHHHNITQQTNKQQEQEQGLPVKVQRLSFFYTCQKKKSGDSFVVLDLWDSCPRHTRRR